MANYNTFAVVESKHGKIVMVTSSARKAVAYMMVGRRVEVWNNNEKVASIIYKNRVFMRNYVAMEKAYIQKKQERATKRRLHGNSN